MKTYHSIWIGLSGLVFCGLVLLPATADEGKENATEMLGDGQIRVHVGKPFVISKSTGHHWFPTLKQISPKHLFAGIWAAADAAMSEEGVHTVGLWTQDGGRTWGEPVSFRGKEAGGHSWIRLGGGTCSASCESVPASLCTRFAHPMAANRGQRQSNWHRTQQASSPISCSCPTVCSRVASAGPAVILCSASTAKGNSGPNARPSSKAPAPVTRPSAKWRRGSSYTSTTWCQPDGRSWHRDSSTRSAACL